ncbi:MAG: arginase family protein, partial [Bacteroidota bacterium]
LIGKDIELGLAQYQSYQARRLVNMALVDEQIRLTPSPKKKSDHQLLNRLIKKRKPRLFHLSAIAYQIHYTPQKVLDPLEKKHFDLLRLGKIKSDMTTVEPLIRDADMLLFHLAALKAADAPALATPSPSGLTSEEACQISRYAGLSDKLTSAGFYGLQPEKDQDGRSAQVIAQLIWYLIDGFAHRKNDYPVSTDGLVEYIVELKNPIQQIHFWKSNKSGRWWIQVPIKSKKKALRHQLVPCSYADYQMACQEDVPERLLNAYRRFA